MADDLKNRRASGQAPGPINRITLTLNSSLMSRAVRNARRLESCLGFRPTGRFVVRKRDANRILNLSLRPILPLFFAGSMTGFPGLPAATLGAQVPAGLFVRAFVETCQAEIPGTITPT